MIIWRTDGKYAKSHTHRHTHTHTHTHTDTHTDTHTHTHTHTQYLQNVNKIKVIYLIFYMYCQCASRFSHEREFFFLSVIFFLERDFFC